MAELSPLCGPIETQTLSPGHGDIAGTGLVTGCAVPNSPSTLFLMYSAHDPFCGLAVKLVVISKY